ncbi:unnamed protein product [Callosobruchus maculatus]|uniref:Odorant receptor n=1 Tax=Callosobruchus maculatus TaxID=64391 RepID=A0A653DAT9_CALMS|nr:unnamed protein product [Callosobruchus maculatus]
MMKLDLVSLLEPDIIALKLVGFWKSSDDVSSFNRFYYRIYRGVVVASTLVYLVCGFMYLYDKRETLTLVDVNSVMFIHTTNVTNPMMVVSIFLNIRRLHAMIRQLESAAFQPKSQKEFLYVYKWKRSSYFIKKIFYGVNIFLVTTGPIVAMLQGKCAPQATYIPPWIYWRVYFWFQSTLTVYNATMASIYVSVLTTLLIEAIIQVACLKERLHCTEDKKYLVESIKRHLQIIFGVINICTTLSLVLEVTFIDLLFMIPYLGEIILIIYVHCFYGSILASESEEIAYSLFSSKWVSADVSHKRNLAIFMIFSNKKITIRLAGGMLTMTLPLFVQIIRTAYAYFNVLQSID